MNILRLCLVALVMVFFAGPVVAQETCADQEAFETCLSDAEVACQQAHPGCEEEEEGELTTEEVLALLDAECDCDTAKNFGKYNSCLKKFRNGIRKIGNLSAEVKDALKDARGECKVAQKEKKKGNKGNKGGEEE